MSNNTSVEHPLAKGVTAIASASAASALAAGPHSGTVLFGIPLTSMADVASLFATIYTLCLLLEFVWRKFIHPFGEDRKWFKRKFRRKSDQYIHDKYGA